MSSTSRTGLIASPTKKLTKFEKVGTVQLRAIARPAPFTLKPFAGLYNPYPYGCSLLCNHPTDIEAKELLRKAKDVWATEGKNLLLAEEVAAIKAGLEQLQTARGLAEKEITGNNDLFLSAGESVPEELFRRYTETDSRPLTPAPTLASAATRASGSRRCVTPDPMPTNHVREKTLLILDLRKSHSQETLSWYGSSSLQEPPIIRIQKAPTRSCSPAIGHESCSPSLNNRSKQHLLGTNISSPNNHQTLKSPRKKPIITVEDSSLPVNDSKENKDETAAGDLVEYFSKNEREDGEDDDEFIKRRGKKRRKKREGSRGPPAFQQSIDPETQVAAIGDVSHNPSARPSLVPAQSDEIPDSAGTPKKSDSKSRKSLEINNSFLDADILRHLRRELDEEVIDNEFNLMRRKALEEALKTVPKDAGACEELAQLQKELRLPTLDTDFLLSLPRIFSRSSARFELPLDSRSLQGMTPLQYVKSHVSITSSRKLLYNCIFNRFKIDTEIEENGERKIQGTQIQPALDLMMGKPMTEEQKTHFRRLVGWREEGILDFKTFAGLCALCERLLAPEYRRRTPSRKEDPCHEIEIADFKALPRKLAGQKVDQNLVEILNAINTK